MGGFFETQTALIVVGSGIDISRDLTPGARSAIENADKVLYVVSDVIAVRTLKDLNGSAESLDRFYAVGKPRQQTYLKMVEHIMGFVRDGRSVCVVSYGHPGLFAYPMHEAIRRARSEGFSATMLPGVSSLDCLIADLGLDPGVDGMQVLDASDYLLHRRAFDVTSDLVLLQVGLTGESAYKEEYDRDGLRLLADLLRERYGADHKAFVYEASEYPICAPEIQPITIGTIMDAELTSGSTLYVPPKGRPELDKAMWQRLKTRQPELRKG